MRVDRRVLRGTLALHEGTVGSIGPSASPPPTWIAAILDDPAPRRFVGQEGTDGGGGGEVDDGADEEARASSLVEAFVRKRVEEAFPFADPA